MTFPCVELKFSNILRNDSLTSLLVRLYRVDDGGPDGDGHPIYLRTLLRERTVIAPPNVTKAQVLSVAQQKPQDWASEEGYTLTSDRLLCSL